jgi:DNA polymerase elongation subunit (family B)
VWDVLIYNYLRKEHIVVPEKSEQVKDTKYDGAYVKEPLTGMHDWIVSFDINSLYPHLIMQYNISPEKIVGMNPEGTSVNKLLSRKLNLDHLKGQDVCMAPNGATFKRDNAGFLPRLLDKMYQDRVVYKDKMMKAKKLYQETKDDKYKNEIARCHNIQWAKKIALNSAYGAIGNQYFRYYDVRQATAITSSGQLVIRHIETEVNNYMNKILQTENEDYIVASDTDSIYLKLDSLVEKTCKDKTIDQKVNFIDKVAQQKIEPFIEKCFNELSDYTNAFEQRMVMKREVIADKAIWTAKKRYMLHVLDDEGIRLTKPKMKIMGIEAVKSSTPEVCRGRIKEAIDMMMTKDNDTLIKFVADFREEFNQMTPEQISFPRSCNNLKKYRSSKDIFVKGTPIHVKGALIYNQKIKEHKIDHIYPAIQEGDKIKFIKLKSRNPFKNDVISYITKLPREFELDEYIDRDLMFEKTFITPLSFILESIGWDVEKKASLEAFFG